MSNVRRQMTSIEGVRAAILRDWDAKNCAALVVSADETVPESMSGYRVYVNGNAHGTPPRFSHLAPANGMYTRVVPGSYRVVVRKADHFKGERAESNTLNVETQKDEILHLRLALSGGKLELLHADA